MDDLIEVDGWWFPAYDAADAPRLGPYIRRNLSDITIAADMCKQRKLCVQAGGHVGMWPKRLAEIFKTVITFEAQPAAFAAMTRNIGDIDNIELHSQALGGSVGGAMMRIGPDSGTWRIDPNGTVPVDVVTIDSLNLSVCDAIYLDIEGAEAATLQGAAETIAKFKPMLHVEILPRSHQAIRQAMNGLGYRFVRSVHKDSIYAPQ